MHFNWNQIPVKELLVVGNQYLSNCGSAKLAEALVLLFDRVLTTVRSTFFVCYCFYLFVLRAIPFQ